MKFASNLSFMFVGESPTLTGRYALAKQAGFKAVESGFPLGVSVQEVADARSKADVKQILINIYTGEFKAQVDAFCTIFLSQKVFLPSTGDVTKGEMGFAAVPGKEEEFRKSVDLTIEYAKALDCKKYEFVKNVPKFQGS